MNSDPVANSVFYLKIAQRLCEHTTGKTGLRYNMENRKKVQL